MSGLAYIPARTAAAKVYPHFERHLRGENRPLDTKLAALPDLATMEAIIEAAFWASLQREERYTPLISLAFVTPAEARVSLQFERPLQLGSMALTRLAPAVERPGIHLGVCGGPGDLRVWGATRRLPTYCFVLEVVAPGMLVIKHSRSGEAGKFINVAVLLGDEIKIIDQLSTTLRDAPPLFASFAGPDARHGGSESFNVLIELAVSMRAHGRGGLLVVTPGDTETWMESMAQPLMYAVRPPFSALADLLREPLVGRPERRWQEAARRAIDGIAGLTAVDGAAVMNDRYEVLAFGAKVVRRRGQPTVAQVMLTEPVEGVGATLVEPSELGGTRHLAGAQFAHDQHDSMSLVASQDGRFTVFAWSEREGMVHAHRIETLLM